jgi:Flp pilus assembly protein TadG
MKWLLVPRLSVVWGRLRKERGTALAELAVVMPVLLVLLLGMLDFGKAFNEWINETHLANEGARLAAVNYCPNPSQADCGWAAKGCPVSGTACLAWYVANQADVSELKPPGRAASTISPQQNAAQACITYPNAATTQVGDPVHVFVKVKYHWLNYLSSQLSLGATVISGNATMRLESLPASTADACWPTTGGAGT